MKTRVVTTIQIVAPPPEVFRYLADLQYHRQWNPHLVQVEPLAKLVEGMEYHTANLLFGITTNGKIKVTKLVQNHELVLSNVTGMVEFLVQYRLQGKAGGTLLTCRTAVSTDSKAFAFARPMLQALARRELNTDMEALKQLVENGPGIRRAL